MDPMTGMMLGQMGGSLLGGLGGLFGGDSGPSAAELQMAMLRKIENMYKEQGVRRELAFRDATAQKQGLLDKGLADFDIFSNRVTGSSRDAQRSTAAAGEQAKAGSTQSLIGKGMGNSTIAQQSKNQIGAFTQQGINSLRNQEADRLNAVGQAKTQFRTNMGNDLSELPIRNLGFSQSDNNSLAGILGNVQFQEQPGTDWGGIGGALGGLAGFGFSGGFGGFGGGLGPGYGPDGMGPPNPNVRR